MAIRVIYSHTLRGHAFGRKAEFLKYLAFKKGYSFNSIDYENIYDMNIRSKKLVDTCHFLRSNSLENDEYYILVGTGAGAYVSLISSQILSSNILGMLLISPLVDVQRNIYASPEVLNIKHYSLMGSHYKNKYPVPFFKNNISNLAIVHGKKDEVVPYPIVENFSKRNRGKIFAIPEGNHELTDIFPVLEKSFLRISYKTESLVI